jgi:hypothetical protein
MNAKLEPTPGPHSPGNPRYPDVRVQLTGHDGNAFAIIGRCCAAARRAGVDPREIAVFQAEAIGGDYDNVLVTAMRWFDVD